MGGKNIHKALLASVYLMAATRVNEATASGYGFQLQKSSARAFTFSTHNGQAVGVKRDCLDAALNAMVLSHTLLVGSICAFKTFVATQKTHV
jgi:hypothetical protein